MLSDKYLGVLLLMMPFEGMSYVIHLLRWILDSFVKLPENDLMLFSLALQGFFSLHHGSRRVLSLIINFPPLYNKAFLDMIPTAA